MTDNKRKFTIGRARDCDVVLADSSVSRYHAQLDFLDEGKLLLIDCHSTYGTAIRGTQGHFLPIHQKLVSPTDTVRFGDATLTVKQLIETIQLRFPIPVASPPKPSVVQGRRLVRCRCGHPKPIEGICPECGR